MKFTSELWDTTCQWDHTVLSATRQRWPPRLHPNRAGW